MPLELLVRDLYLHLLSFLTEQDKHSLFATSTILRDKTKGHFFHLGKYYRVKDYDLDPNECPSKLVTFPTNDCELDGMFFDQLADGRVVCRYPTGLLNIYDAANNQLIASINSSEAPIHSITVLANNSLANNSLALTDQNGLCNIWADATNINFKKSAELKTGLKDIHDVIQLNQDRVVFTTSNGIIQFWNYKQNSSLTKQIELTDVLKLSDVAQQPENNEAPVDNAFKVIGIRKTLHDELLITIQSEKQYYQCLIDIEQMSLCHQRRFTHKKTLYPTKKVHYLNYGQIIQYNLADEQDAMTVVNQTADEKNQTQAITPPNVLTKCKLASSRNMLFFGDYYISENDDSSSDAPDDSTSENEINEFYLNIVEYPNPSKSTPEK